MAVERARLQRLRTISINILIAGISVLLTLLGLEMVVRLAGDQNADGQFTFMGHTLQPYALPVTQLRADIQGYLANKDSSYVLPDSLLGWTYRPNSVWQDLTFTINNDGLRAKREYSRQPPIDTLRIALFGDSFVAGDEVSDEEVWGYKLRDALGQAGIRTEVLNFGVGAYGMGQAFLRWQHEGKNFDPDIVIFGLQPENLLRNVNVFRQLLHGSGPPFSKPRFALVDSELVLLNWPAIPPEQLGTVFADFANHALAPWEYHYRSRHLTTSWWSSSKLASLVYEISEEHQDDPEVYSAGSEGGSLGLAIVDAFAADVAAQDAVFLILHLPTRSHLVRHFNEMDPPYRFLLEHSGDNYNYIPMEHHMEPRYVDNVYWRPNLHYGPEINALVGRVVADWVESCLRNPQCKIPRVNDLFLD